MLKDLLLDKYIELTVNDDLQQLVKTGNPPEEVLMEAKLSIISQGQDIVSSTMSQHYKRILADLEAIKVRINRISTLITTLKAGYNQELIDELAIDGYDHPFSPESFEQDIINCEYELKNEMVDLELHTERFKTVSEQSEGKKTTREDFLRILQVGSKMDGFRYAVKDLYSDEYFTLLNRIIEDSKPKK